MRQTTILCVVLAACGGTSNPMGATDAPEQGSADGSSMGDASTTEPVVFVGAGDIAGGGPGAGITAQLIQNIPGTVFTIGDNAYDSGAANDFTTRFDPTWGRFKSRIQFPTPGNHDYITANASAYFAYFGALAGDPSKGYYSRDLGAWHIIVINSNCSAVGGCQAGSAQEQWLRADLAAHPNKCTLAMWHHPLWNTGEHGDDGEMYPITQALYEGGADVVLTGHDHDYQRWTPMTHNGVPDDNGLRAFVVGTGGIGFYSFTRTDPHCLVRDNQTFGVLKLTLRPTDYSWEFVGQPGSTFTDSGTGTCH